jgi:transcriptional regulator with XRE-family HTH domain
MDNEKMGQFIAELRKSRQMTQKDLAEMLNISDKAVSKWERGLSSPDISLLSPISDIFGITASELLNGERNSSESRVNDDESITVVSVLEYCKKNSKITMELVQNISAAVFTILILIGISVVSIVNVAVSGTFTWSLIPIISAVFAWVIFIPTIKYGIKGIFSSLVILSFLSIPFLYMLDYAVNMIIDSHAPVFPLGIRIAPLSIAFFWVAFFLLKKFKKRKLFAIAILVLLSMPLNFIINFTISKMWDRPWLDAITILNTITTATIAVIIFVIDFIIRNRK